MQSRNPCKLIEDDCFYVIIQIYDSMNSLKLLSAMIFIGHCQAKNKSSEFEVDQIILMKLKNQSRESKLKFMYFRSGQCWCYWI